MGDDTGDVDQHSHLQSNSIAKPTPSLGFEKERRGPPHSWGWGKGFSYLGVPLGSQNDAETKSEKQTNKTPAQEKEGAEGPSLKHVPCCAKGFSLGLGGGGHGVSLPTSSAWRLKDEL